MSYVVYLPTGEQLRREVLAEVFDPAPREMACHSWRYEGPELIDGRPALGYLIHSSSRPYRVYRLTYMVDTREIFCPCEDCAYRKGSMAGRATWGTDAEQAQPIGPQITRQDEGLCKHQRLIKEIFVSEGLRMLQDAMDMRQAA